MNAPLVEGDQIATDSGSRAEVQLDYANVVRLNQASTVKVADLEQGHVQVQIGQGLIDYTVLRGSGQNAEIDTPNMAVHPFKEGDYRVQVDSPGQAKVIVHSGEAQVSTPQGATTVHAGEMITVEGVENAQYQVAPAPGRDEWDSWNAQRDHIITDARSWQYTNQYYTGASDLDSYGRWTSDPQYGQVWQPNVDPGWTPYSDGTWVDEPYYGYTWVPSEPWGWAPYHYGRWFTRGPSWCWWPGPVTPAYYPVWSPAYVSFFGFGFGHWGFGFGFNNIGWLPVGPADPFYPWWGGFGFGFTFWGGGGHDHWDHHGGWQNGGGWGHGGYGYNAVSVHNINNINNFNSGNGGVPPLYRGGAGQYGSNLGRLSSPTMQRSLVNMPASQFGNARVRGRGSLITGAELQQGRLVQGNLPVVPTRASLSPTNQFVAQPGTVRTAANQRFFTTRPTIARPASFNDRVAQTRQLVQTNPVQSGNGISVRANPVLGRTAGAFPNPMGNAGAQNARSTPFPSPGAARGAMPGAYNSGRLGTGVVPPAANGSERAPVTRGYAQSNAGARPGWQTFGNESGLNGRSSSPYSAPRTVQPAPGAYSRGPSAAPQANPGGGWQQFSQRPLPYGSQSNVPGSNRFPAANPPRAYSNPAPRSYVYSSPGSARPPLQLNKPIMTPRTAPPSYSGSPYGGAAPRTYSPPPQRSYSSPTPRSYGGYSAPATPSYSPPQRSYNPPQRSYSAPVPRTYGGYSAPSRTYSAPAQRSYSPPSRTSGGGYSAPRSYSAPAQRGYSPPSGGGGYRGGGGGNGRSHERRR
jgi:hypothetical protein